MMMSLPCIKTNLQTSNQKTHKKLFDIGFGKMPFFFWVLGPQTMAPYFVRQSLLYF